MKVKLSYFKPSGKWYSDGEFDAEPKALYEIWHEVERLRDRGRLPGLMPGHSPYIVFVDVPEHEHNHPHLVTLPK